MKCLNTRRYERVEQHFPIYQCHDVTEACKSQRVTASAERPKNSHGRE